MVKELLRSMLKAIGILSGVRIVHSDLKPDNILVSAHSTFTLIDFGSAFLFDTTDCSGMNTPEYAPPEMLCISSGPLSEISNPWSFDIWSLGMIFLELCAGFPVWLSLKSRINGKGKF
jgi:serine/threonine protein kinase